MNEEVWRAHPRDCESADRRKSGKMVPVAAAMAAVTDLPWIGRGRSSGASIIVSSKDLGGCGAVDRGHGVRN